MMILLCTAFNISFGLLRPRFMGSMIRGNEDDRERLQMLFSDI